jgi:hypothetical protein
MASMADVIMGHHVYPELPIAALVDALLRARADRRLAERYAGGRTVRQRRPRRPRGTTRRHVPMRHRRPPSTP